MHEVFYAYELLRLSAQIIKGVFSGEIFKSDSLSCLSWLIFFF